MYLYYLVYVYPKPISSKRRINVKFGKRQTPQHSYPVKQGTKRSKNLKQKHY